MGALPLGRGSTALHHPNEHGHAPDQFSGGRILRLARRSLLLMFHVSTRKNPRGPSTGSAHLRTLCNLLGTRRVRNLSEHGFTEEIIGLTQPHCRVCITNLTVRERSKIVGNRIISQDGQASGHQEVGSKRYVPLIASHGAKKSPQLSPSDLPNEAGCRCSLVN
jgi:hypothetical protein